MAIGECSDSKVEFAAWPMSWRPPGTDRLSLRGGLKVNSRIWLRARDDSTINIVLCIIIIIIIITTTTTNYYYYYYYNYKKYYYYNFLTVHSKKV